MQWELAERIGVKETRVRHLEAGDFGGVRPDVFRRLAELMNTNPDGLREMIEKWQLATRGKIIPLKPRPPKKEGKPPERGRTGGRGSQRH